MFINSMTSAVHRVVVGSICLVLLSSLCILQEVEKNWQEQQQNYSVAFQTPIYDASATRSSINLWSNDTSATMIDLINSLHYPSSSCQLLLCIQVQPKDIFNGLDRRNMLRVFYNEHQTAPQSSVRVQFLFPRPTSQMETHLILMEQESHGDVFVLSSPSHDETPLDSLILQQQQRNRHRQLQLQQRSNWIAVVSADMAVNLDKLNAYLRTLRSDFSKPAYITLSKMAHLGLLPFLLVSTKHSVLSTIDEVARPDPTQLNAAAYSVDCAHQPAFYPSTVFVAYNCSYLKTWNSGLAMATSKLPTISSTTINSLIPKQQQHSPLSIQKKKLLLGVFSYFTHNATAATAAQRNLVRILYKNIQNANQLNIDVRFIVGVPSSSAGMKMLLLEQELYRDLIMVTVGENMDDGKSFHYFTQMEKMMKEGVIPEYDFIGKCDADTYINLRGLKGELDKIQQGQQKFVGLDSLTTGEKRQFMFGMLYILSRPLLQRVAQLQLGVDELKLPEDLLMSKVVAGFGKDVEWVSLQFTNKEGCLKVPYSPFSREDIATHWCKKPEEMWRNFVMFERLYAS
ncbi:hypothetical protein BDR26DRAFT_866001 [Obelidium mucronatum]|nr:hypothetical protein BDR26DRAFT_866001 [Obelidium mucronatum]